MTNPRPQTQVLSDREFVLTHTFRAPAAKVFAAYTDPKLLPLWWGRKGGTLRVEAMDVRPDGHYRFHQSMPNGQSAVYSGTYLEVSPVSRLVYTFQVEGQTPPLTATVELSETGDGSTVLTLTNLCASKEVRDSMVQFGAAAGAKAAWDQLAELLATPSAVPPSPAGLLGYTTLFVSDQDRALEFYTKVLGLQVRGDAPQPGGHRFIALNAPGQDSYLVLWPGSPGRSADVKGNVPGHLIFLVEDIDRAFADLKARGARFEQAAPVKAPFASFVTVIDPDGHRIMVQQQAARAPGT
jgi:uncharacterized protein YndB with AHSA1/START domain/catechol 2,3-dioxygenase-like lactoylglutathione lyase family enzyme